MSLERDTESVKRARFFVDKWMPRFGFGGHWRVEVYRLQEKYKGKVWAHGFWNMEEEHVLFEFVPDGALPDTVLEMLVIHEVAHGLVELGKTSEHGEEVVCNRVAKVLKPRAKHPNEWYKTKKSFFDLPDETRLGATRELTARQRYVVHALFNENRSLGSVARDLGVTKRAVALCRDAALKKLKEELDNGSSSL